MTEKHLSRLQQKVANKAEELSASGKVCLDNMPEDVYIARYGIDRCAEELAMDTAFWDGFFK